MDRIAAPHSMIGAWVGCLASDPGGLRMGLSSLELALAVPRLAIMVGEY